MAKPAVRKGDTTNGDPEHEPLSLDLCMGDVGGNGKPIGILGDKLTSGGKHGVPTIVECSGTVLINGKGVARQGDKVSCGDAFANGSPDILVG